MNKIINEGGYITTDTTEKKKSHKRLIRTIIYQQIEQPIRNR